MQHRRHVRRRDDIDDRDDRDDPPDRLDDFGVRRGGLWAASVSPTPTPTHPLRCIYSGEDLVVDL